MRKTLPLLRITNLVEACLTIGYVGGCGVKHMVLESTRRFLTVWNISLDQACGILSRTCLDPSLSHYPPLSAISLCRFAVIRATAGRAGLPYKLVYR